MSALGLTGAAKLALFLLGALALAAGGWFLFAKPSHVSGTPSSIRDLGLPPPFTEGPRDDSKVGGSNPSQEGALFRLPVAAYVTGAVNSPGVYFFPEGRRVVDALEAAGGASPDADVSKLNLAAPLEDGVRIYVPRVGDNPPEEAEASAMLSKGGPASQPGSGTSKVNINRAPASELEKLPGIGPALAERIVEDRKRNGPFKKAQDLARVPGIGDVKIAQLAPFIAF